MADMKDSLQKAITRANANGDTKVNDLKTIAIRHYDEPVMGEGEYDIPQDMEFRIPSNGKGAYFFAADGTKIWVSAFQRRAVDANGVPHTCTGDAVDAVQNSLTWEEAKAKLAGKTIILKKVETVATKKYGDQIIWDVTFKA